MKAEDDTIFVSGEFTAVCRYIELFCLVCIICCNVCIICIICLYSSAFAHCHGAMPRGLVLFVLFVGLLQRFPSKFVDIGDSQNGLVFNGSSLQEMAMSVILSILKPTAFSRDCLVAAGVSFCAALQALLSVEELAYFIIHAVFQRKVCKLVTDADSDYKNAASRVPYTGDLIFELNNSTLQVRHSNSGPDRSKTGILLVRSRSLDSGFRSGHRSTQYHYSGSGPVLDRCPALNAGISRQLR